MFHRELPAIGLCIAARADFDGNSRRRRGTGMLRRVFADLTITATSVTTSSNNKKSGTAGETITAGQALYLKSSDLRLWKAQADGTAAEAEFVGVALNGGAAGQPIFYQDEGDITIGATVAVGTLYVVSATAGGIAPNADITTTGYYKTLIGYGKTSSVLTLYPKTTGVTMP